jgi:mono/diheme cytochrome c family protein
VKPALAVVLLGLASCGGPGPADSEADKETGNVPAAVRYDQYGAAGESVPPAEDLVNPYSGDSAAAQQGQVLFDTMNCSGCHGGGAVGFVGPSLVDGRWKYGGDDGAMFHSIFYGRPNGMPAYGGMLAEETIWQMVVYVRSQPLPDVVPTVSWP